MALIELDLAVRHDPAPASPPPAHRHRLSGLLVALLLVVTLGGALPPASTLWRDVGTVPLPTVDTPFLISGDLLVTVAGEGDDGQVATGWALGEGVRRVWTVPIPARQAGRNDVGFARGEASRVRDTVLVANGPATTALDAHTGRTRWTLPVPVLTLPGGGFGVTTEPTFRPGTLYDQASGDPGMIYFSPGGEPHTEPPQRTDIHGVDLATGRTVWTAPAAGSVNVLAAPGDAAAVLILASDRLERRDGRTGDVQQRVALSRIGGNLPYGGEIVDGTLVVRYGDSGGVDVGYAPDTLRRLWSRNVTEVLLDPPRCDDVICTGKRSDLRVLDAATGRARWQPPTGVDLIRRGGYLLEVDSRSGLLAAIADPRTGRRRVDLGGWRAEVIGEGDGPIVLRRSPSRAISLFGVVLSRRDAVQPLGRVDGFVSDCGADGGHVVCRGRGGLRIWAYRA